MLCMYQRSNVYTKCLAINLNVVRVISIAMRAIVFESSIVKSTSSEV